FSDTTQLCAADVLANATDALNGGIAPFNVTCDGTNVLTLQVYSTAAGPIYATPNAGSGTGHATYLAGFQAGSGPAGQAGDRVTTACYRINRHPAQTAAQDLLVPTLPSHSTRKSRTRQASVPSALIRLLSLRAPTASRHPSRSSRRTGPNCACMTLQRRQRYYWARRAT